jgi:hypothetical protein
LFAWEYKDWRESNVNNAKYFREAVEKKFGKDRPVAVVAHSLGSVPTRYAIKKDADFRKRVATWTSLGGPNRGAGQNFWGTVGLHLACTPGGRATEHGKKIAPDLVHDSTCELSLGSLMDDLNWGPDGPLPTTTDYEEVISTSDSVVSNDATLLPGVPNNHHWKIANIQHPNLPRDAEVIKHVVERVKKGPYMQGDESREISIKGQKRTCGDGACLKKLYGTASPWAVQVIVTLKGHNFQRRVDVQWGEWSQDLSSLHIKSKGGSFNVEVKEVYGPRRTKSDRV